MNKYNNSKIYKITSKIEPFYYYIGSTTLKLKRRLTHHKSNANKYPDNKKNKHFLSINWDVNIDLIKEINTNSLKELRVIENNYIQQFINCPLCLNTNDAIMNKEKRKKCIRDNSKNYYINNKSKIKLNHDEYYEKNKNKYKDFYNNNINEIKERKSQIINCICGKEITINNKARHEKSKVHCEFIKGKYLGS